jgi:hypothetical protein
MKKLVLSLIASCFIVPSVFAQDSKEVDPNKDVEIIEVIGQFTPAQWGKIAESAKVDFYELFNEVNDIDDYRMICRAEKEIGSNIKKMKCEPQYYKDRMAQMVQEVSFRRGTLDTNFMPKPQDVALSVKDTKEKADKHLLALVDKHPHLRKKFEYYVKAFKAHQMSEELNK